MANPNGRLGAGYEADVRDYLNEVEVFATEVHRAPRWGVKDKADFTGTGDWAIEAKNWKVIDLARFADETEVERKNAGRRFGACFIKRRGKNVRQSYVLISTDTFIELVRSAALATAV